MLGGLEDGLAELVGAHIDEWRCFGALGSVEADGCVDVDDAAGLELDHLRVRDPCAAPELCRGEPGLGSEGAAESDGEAAPELGGVPLPQHVGGVVVALETQRLAELSVLVAVPGEAGQRPTMGTDGVVAAGSARAFAAAAVDEAERWGGEGGERGRMIRDRLRDDLAAGHATHE